MITKIGLALFGLALFLIAASVTAQDYRIIQRPLTDDQRLAFAMLRADQNYYPTCHPGYHGQRPVGPSPAQVLREWQAYQMAKKGITEPRPSTQWGGASEESIRATVTKETAKKSSRRAK